MRLEDSCSKQSSDPETIGRAISGSSAVDGYEVGCHDKSCSAKDFGESYVNTGERRETVVAEPVHVDKARARRIMGGDEGEFRSLFDEYFPRLYRFALVRLDGDDESAREVVQQTFCKGIEKLDTYRGEAALYAWFCRICRNALVDHCRRRNQEVRRLVLIEDKTEVRAVLEALSAGDREGPESRAIQRDVSRFVQSVLDYLPKHYGDVLEWKYVEGLTVNEIAQRTGSGPKAVESLLTRARGAFRDAVAALGGAVAGESAVFDGIEAK